MKDIFASYFTSYRTVQLWPSLCHANEEKYYICSPKQNGPCIQIITVYFINIYFVSLNMKTIKVKTFRNFAI